jgi:hypothetical protein
MTEDTKKEKIMLEDGRRAERIITGSYDPEKQESVEVVETWVEPKVEQRLARRQITKTRPCVCERQTELIDENTGDIIQTEVETIDPEVKLQVKERIVSAASVSSPKDNGVVTREELREDIKDAIVILANTLGKPADDVPFSVQNVIEDRVDSNKVSITNVVLLGIIAAVAGGILWIMFAM